MTSGNANLHCSAAFIETLAHLGAKHVFLSPGSRSAPLTVAAARARAVGKHVILDERAAAFAALGAAKATGVPAVLVCTSGTAGANYAPAVWEASLSSTPLIIVTADRPPELQRCGAAQTMPQTGLFGEAVRASYTLPVPGDAETDRVFRAIAARAWTAALRLQGPVHVNAPFREPLLPEILSTRTGFKPVSVAIGHATLDPADAAHLRETLERSRRLLIVCGPHTRPPERLLAFAAAWQAPVLADIASGLRFGDPDGQVVSYHHAILQSWPERAPAPDVVLHAGSLPVSKQLQAWLQSSNATHIAVHEGEWSDPNHLADLVYQVPADALTAAVGLPRTERDAQFLHDWKAADLAMRQAIHSILAASEASEAKLGMQLPDLLHDGDLLFLSNSMPIRDAEMFCTATEKDVQVLVNRGVNGIDGILSTACGAAAAVGRRLLLVIGDLAFQHDIGGLASARELGVRGTVIVVNNAGGAIFSHLPVRQQTDVFESYFSTPQHFDVASAAHTFGIPCRTVRTNTAVAEVVADQEPFQIVEFVVDREQNVREHEALWARLREVQPA